MSSKRNSQTWYRCLVLSKFGTVIHARSIHGYLYQAKKSCTGIAQIYKDTAGVVAIVQADIPQVWLSCFDEAINYCKPWVIAPHRKARGLFTAQTYSKVQIKTLIRKYQEEEICNG